MDELNTVAGGTNTEWFTNLSFIELKAFYRNLEDIWNFRSELSHEKKLAIVPTNNAFKNNLYYIMNLPLCEKHTLQQIILNEIELLVSSAIDNENKSTGCYYVLIAFTEISPEIAAEMPWLIQY